MAENDPCTNIKTFVACSNEKIPESTELKKHIEEVVDRWMKGKDDKESTGSLGGLDELKDYIKKNPESKIATQIKAIPGLFDNNGELLKKAITENILKGYFIKADQRYWQVMRINNTEQALNKINTIILFNPLEHREVGGEYHNELGNSLRFEGVFNNYNNWIISISLEAILERANSISLTKGKLKQVDLADTGPFIELADFSICNANCETGDSIYTGEKYRRFDEILDKIHKSYPKLDDTKISEYYVDFKKFFQENKEDLKYVLDHINEMNLGRQSIFIYHLVDYVSKTYNFPPQGEFVESFKKQGNGFVLKTGNDSEKLIEFEI